MSCEATGWWEWVGLCLHKGLPTLVAKNLASKAGWSRFYLVLVVFSLKPCLKPECCVNQVLSCHPWLFWQQDCTDADTLGDGQQHQASLSICTSFPFLAEQEGFTCIYCSSSCVSIRVRRTGGGTLFWFTFLQQWKLIRFICIQKAEWRGRRVNGVVHPDGFFNSGGK